MVYVPFEWMYVHWFQRNKIFFNAIQVAIVLYSHRKANNAFVILGYF